MKDPSIIALEAWARSSAETLSTLLGQGAALEEPRSFIVSPTELGAVFEKGAFFMPLTLNAALMGPTVLAIEGQTALKMAASMLAEEEPPPSFTPLHAEILGEAVKQIASFLGDVLSQAMGHEVSVHEGDATFGSLPDLGAPLYIAAEFPIKLRQEGLISLHLILPAGLAEELSKGAAQNGFQSEPDEEAERPSASPTPSAASSSASATAPEHSQARFDQLGGGNSASRSSSTAPLNGGMELILDVPLEVMAVLGRTSMMIEELLTIDSGSVIELDKLAGEPVELFVKDRLIAVGEVVVVDERFGVKILEMVSGRRRVDTTAAGF